MHNVGKTSKAITMRNVGGRQRERDRERGKHRERREDKIGKRRLRETGKERLGDKARTPNKRKEMEREEGTDEKERK